MAGHRDAEIYTSLPGLDTILAARILGEFGDAPDRYPDAKARKNALSKKATSAATHKGESMFA